MTPPKTILIPTDFSETAEHARYLERDTVRALARLNATGENPNTAR